MLKNTILATKYAYNYSWFTSNEHLTSVDNVQQFVVVQKFVCIIFCRVISQQHGGSGDLRNKDFVIAILHCHKFIYRCLRKWNLRWISVVHVSIGITFIINFNEFRCNVILQILKQTSIWSIIYTIYTNNKQYGNVLRC